ncbi:MAG: 3,5-cyclic-nucleotide phosphodiesterase [Rhizobacter sp.]|nr:3,5-cyclic-nucleotide phosphodiesterase [Rhizobacter sp.]
MKLRVLGCSGAIAAGCRTTAFLLDDDVLVDAGTGVGDLTIDELARIDHIFVTHSHLDHVLGIGLLADTVLRVRAADGRPPIEVHALAETIAALRTHIFNGVIWPDFTRLPTAQAPVLRLVEVDVGQVVVLPARRDAIDGSRHFEILSAVHSVPAVGIAAKGETGWWVFTGDTGPNAALWARLATMPVAHLVIETAFADDEEALAKLSQHLHPAALAHELKQLGGSIDVHITHIKPGESEAVMREACAIDTPHRIHALEAGQSVEF